LAGVEELIQVCVHVCLFPMAVLVCGHWGVSVWRRGCAFRLPFGVLVFICGACGRKPRTRTHVGHGSRVGLGSG
jgi:hypothetical protein